MKIGLLIQRTFNGLNTEYVSENALASFDTKLFLTDERNVAMQLSEAPVFSVAQKGQAKCYSFIKRTLDREKRSGFYAIRLFIEVTQSLKNLKQQLTRIAQEYEKSLQTPGYSADYPSLLKEVEKDLAPLEYTFDKGKIKSGEYYAFLSAQDDLNTLLERDGAYFAEKLYIFTQSIDRNHLAEFRLQPLEGIATKRLILNDSYNYISEVWIGDKGIPVQGNKLSTYKFLALQEDNFYYKSALYREKQLIPTGTFSVKSLKIENPEGYIEKLWVNDVEIKGIKERTSITVCYLEGDRLFYKVAKDSTKHSVPSGQEVLSVARPQQAKATTEFKFPKLSWFSVLVIGLLSLAIGGVVGYLYSDSEASRQIALKENEKKQLASEKDTMQKELERLRAYKDSIGSLKQVATASKDNKTQQK